MSLKRSLCTVAIGGMLAAPTLLWAGDDAGLLNESISDHSAAHAATQDSSSKDLPLQVDPALVKAPPPIQFDPALDGKVQQQQMEDRVTVASADNGPAELRTIYHPSASGSASVPLYFDADDEKPNIHGFIEAPFRTAYITPRGLVVENQGLVFQPVGGFVLPIGDLGPLKKFTLIMGVWNSINTAQNYHIVGAWNEMDFFFTMSTNLTDELNLALTYGAWQSPPGGFPTEHNIDLKISYDDSKAWGGNFGIHPYVDIWSAVSGGSTVVLGRPGGTGYLEIGAVPQYTFKAIQDYPITVTVPIYTQIGPKDYWSWGPNTQFGTGNIGEVVAGVNATMPLAFIPARYGFWHVDAGVTYFNLINKTLLKAGNILSGNKDNNIFLGEVGFGVNF